MEQKESDFRYKMQHIGDIFVEAVEGVVDGLKTTFKGVSLTYEIHHLQFRRKKVVYDIGERVVEIRKSDPTISVSTDEPASRLFSEFDEIEERLEASISERESRINSWKFANEASE